MIELFSKLEEIKEKKEYIFYKRLTTVNEEEIKSFVSDITDTMLSVGITEYDVDKEVVHHVVSQSIKIKFTSDKETMVFVKDKYDLSTTSSAFNAIFNNDFLGQWIINDPNPPSPYEPFSSIEFNSDNMNIEIAGEPGVLNRNRNFYPEHTLREAFENIRWN